MACGTGKTLTALWIAEALEPSTTLVLVPSLSLLSQTLSEWAKNANSKWDYLCVCSDETVNKSDDAPISTTDDLPFDVTTKPADIAAFLERRGRKIIFSTYQSSAQVAKAQKTAGKKFDLVICDEAHRLTGKNDAEFATALDDTKIPARKRLFMTATPRTYTASVKAKASERGVEITSMDDETIFGKELHKLSFGQAIEKELLTDYRVVIVGVTDPQVQELIEQRELVSVAGTIETDARTLAAHIGLAKATKDYDLKRTISFHGRIKTAQAFAQQHAAIVEWMPDDHKPSGTIWADTITGAMNSSDRRKLLNKLKATVPGQHALLSNARCLTEGIDVPSLDGVAFIDPRSSQVDIIQAVGRAIRKAENKSLGTIVLPVLIPNDADAEHALEDSAFKPIWAILNALRSHDEDLANQLSVLRNHMGSVGTALSIPRKMNIDLPADIDFLFPGFAEKFAIATIEHSTSSWDYWFGLLLAYVEEFNTPLIPEGRIYRGKPLANWVQTQRSNYNSGKLNRQQINSLQGVSGWTWRPQDDSWENHFDCLQDYVSKTGSSSVPKRLHWNGLQLGQWCQNQRRSYKNHTQSEERVKRLESLSGWTWTILDENWESAYKILVKYLTATNGVYPSAREQFEGFSLGPWVARQRTQRSANSANPNRTDLLESLPGWTWSVASKRNLLGLQRFQRYLASGGSIAQATDAIFEGKKMGQWVSAQRRNYKKGTMPSQMIAAIEELAGWNWDIINDNWNRNYEILKAESIRRGTSLIPIRKKIDGVAIGSWCQKQRSDFARGAISEDRVSLLNALPDWTFSPFEDQWNEMFLLLKRFSENTGHARPTASFISNGKNLGNWTSRQRQNYKLGTLTKPQIANLESLPGWIWNRSESAWMENLQILIDFSRIHGHTSLPEDFSVDGRNIQSWVYNQKQRKRSGKLETDRIQMLEALPEWAWDAHGSRWDKTYQILSEYVLGGGTMPPPKNLKFKGANLSSWMNTQRRKWRDGQLSKDQISLLEKLHGWNWTFHDRTTQH
jgi:superfamily II DNA or RNA helicase